MARLLRDLAFCEIIQQTENLVNHKNEKFTKESAKKACSELENSRWDSALRPAPSFKKMFFSIPAIRAETAELHPAFAWIFGHALRIEEKTGFPWKKN